MELRKILPNDNAQVAQLIRSILEDMNVPKKGTAYSDEALDDMYRTYQNPKSIYYVIVLNKKIIACCGIAPLPYSTRNFCELQKMYVKKDYRGKGLAQDLILASLRTAKEFGFEGCYLETLPFMDAAQELYKKNGFKYLSAPLGNTGHTACTVRMLNEF